MIDSPAIISPFYSAEKLKLSQTIRLGIMASGSGSNFEAIAKAINQGELNAKIEVLIYNNPSAKVKERAEKYGIPSILLNHRDYKTREQLDTAIVEVFRQNQVDLIVMVGWMRIITNTLLSAFPQRVINIHPSLLPSFKGIHAVEQALNAGVKVTGCTVHYADLEVDSGNIIIQSAVPVLPDDNADTLHQRIQIQEHLIIIKAIAIVAQQLQMNHQFSKQKY